MAIEVADLVASLGVDSTKFDSGMNVAEARMKSTSATMRASLSFVGQSALGMGRDLFGALGDLITPAVQFEKIMSGVKAVSGASQAQMKQLDALALQLGKDTTFSASEAGQGIEELVKGGVSIKNIMAGAATATLNLAAAGGVDLASAGEIAANALNMFSLSGKDMAHVADMIAGAANASSLSVMDFRYSLAYAGNAAHAAGFSFDDLTVGIAELGQAGIKGSAAGSGMQDVLTRLAKPTKAAADEMRKLGLITADGKNQFFDAQGHVKKLADVQEILRTSTAGLTNQQRLADFQTLFGQRGMRSAIILAENGAAGFDKMNASIGKVGASSVAQTRMGNLAGQMEQLHGSVETLEISVGTALIPRLTMLAKVGTDVVNGMLDFTQKLPAGFVETATTLAGIAAAALTVGGAAAMLVAAINPITLAIGGLMAAGALLATAWQADWGGIREKVASVWGAVQPILRAIGNEFQALRTVFSIGGAGAVWDVLKAQFAAFGQWLTGWATGVAPTILPHLQAWAGQLLGWISGTAGPAIGTALQRLGSAYASYLQFVIPHIPEVIRGFLALSLRINDWSRSVMIPAIIQQVGSWGQALLGWVGPMIPPLLAQLGTLAGRLWGWITGTAAPAIRQRLGAWATAFGAWAPGAALNLVNQLGPLIDRLAGWINAQLPTLGRHLAAWGGAMWHWVRQALPPLEHEIGRLIAQVGVLLVGAAVKFATWLVPRLPSLIGKFNDMLTGLYDWILTKAIPELVGFGMDMGTQLVQGMIDGLGSMKDKLTDAVGGQAGSMVGGFKDFLGIQSPSSVFHELGVNMMQGLANGLAAHTPTVNLALQGSIGGLSAPGTGGRGGLGGGGGSMVVNVYLSPTGGVSVTGTAGGQAFGRAVGQAVEEIARLFDAAEQRASNDAAPVVLAGARAV